MHIKNLADRFIQSYGNGGDIRFFFSPGRVNLIGEHLDYNGGYVFPYAIDLGTYACVRKRNDTKINIISTNIDEKACIDLRNLEFNKEDDWANYPKGVMYMLKKEGYALNGMDILISGNLPNGAGLSSSASLEILMALIISNLFNEGKIDKFTLIKAAHRAEGEYVGVNCGIMDQFAVCMGKKNSAILLHCGSLKHEYAKFLLGDYSLVIMNTNKQRNLNKSKYNERREECGEALKIIKRNKNIGSLCNLTIENYEELKSLIKDEGIRKRAKHVVYENDRVKRAYEYIRNDKIEEFSKLLIESHESLKNLYEVTGKELDTIVEEALAFESCIGAKMTGAGFGGCAIAIVLKDRVNDFIEKIGRKYRTEIGYYANFYLTGSGEGALEIF